MGEEGRAGLRADPDTGSQGLWRVLMASLKGGNRLWVEKGQWRHVAPQSDGSFQSENQVLALNVRRRGRFCIDLMPQLAASAKSSVVGMRKERRQALA